MENHTLGIQEREGVYMTSQISLISSQKGTSTKKAANDS